MVMNRTHRALWTASVGFFVCSSTAGAQIIGGFSVARGGSHSWASGSYPAAMRQLVNSSFPGVSHTETDTLTPAYLSAVHVVVLSVAMSDSSAISPLTAAEQAALRAFVDAGGSAILMPDNDAFSGGAVAANVSLISPFGMAVTGTLFGSQLVNFSAGPNPLADGPFGQVAQITFNYPAWLTALGGARQIGTLAANGQPAIAIFDRGDLAPGSGRVVVCTDTAAMDLSFGAGNGTAFLNAMDWLGVPTPGTLALLAAGLVAGTRRRR